jgi:hypothetical protein
MHFRVLNAEVSLTKENKMSKKPDFKFVHGSVRDLEEIFPMCTFEDADLAACTKVMGLEVENVNGDPFYPAEVWEQLYGLRQTESGLAILPL